jgi:hypothetical protein
MAAVKYEALKFLFLHVFSVTTLGFTNSCIYVDRLLPSFLENGDEFMPTMKLIMPCRIPTRPFFLALFWLRQDHVGSKASLQ